MPETSWYQTNFIKIYYIWSDKDTDNCHINDCSFHIFIIILFVLKSFNVCSLKVPVIIWLIWERSSNDTVYTIVFILYVIMTLSIYRALKFDIRLVQIRLPVWQDRFFFSEISLSDGSKNHWWGLKWESHKDSSVRGSIMDIVPFSFKLEIFYHLRGKQNPKHRLTHWLDTKPIFCATINKINVKIKTQSIVTALDIYKKIFSLLVLGFCPIYRRQLSDN